MNRIISALLFCCVCFSNIACAQRYQSGDVTSGELGARAGTQIYNAMNPDKPLPITSGGESVMKGTIQGVGAGKAIKDSFSESACNAAGYKNCDNKPPSSSSAKGGRLQ